MNYLKTRILFTVLLAIPALNLSAQMPGEAAQTGTMPKRWLTHVQVETQYGMPLTKSNPVGQPSITYWEYQDYIVYFENDQVLHIVMKNR
jgi:hypothetical protein